MSKTYYVITTNHPIYGWGYARNAEEYTELLKDAKKFKTRADATVYMKQNPQWRQSNEKTKKITEK